MFVRKRRVAPAWLAFALGLVSCWVRAAEVHAQVMGLEELLALARERAPAVLARRAEVESAEARLVGASRLLQRNPVLSGGFGHRSAGESDSTWEGRAALQQEVEVGTRRRARKDVARAAVTRANLDGAEATRLLLRDVALAFLEVLHTEQRRDLLTASEALHAELMRVAERRHAAGDLPRLDSGLAAAALSRVRAELRACDAPRALAMARLRAALGMSSEEPLSLQGTLRDVARFEDATGVPGLDRPDVRALEAAQRGYQAERELAHSQRLPDLGVGGNYERHENAHIGLATLSLSIPLFNRGQAELAEAEARTRGAGQALLATRNKANLEVESSRLAHEAHMAAVLELEEHALPLLDEHERQLRRAYESGELSLGNVLVARREIADTRAAYLDQLLSAAKAGIELRAATNSWERVASPEGPPGPNPKPTERKP